MRCDPNDVALKSFFLGPQAENGPWIRDFAKEILEGWFSWRKERFPEDGRAISEEDMKLPEFQERRQLFHSRLAELISRFENEVPKFSPRYIGHMSSEISLPALLGHLVALLHNPNNISEEASRVGVEIEEEALTALRKMLGFSGPDTHGHFTSGGTIANFESLVRARARMALWLAAGATSRAKQTSQLDLFSAAHLGWQSYTALGHAPEHRELNVYESNPFEVGERISQIFGTRFLGPVALIPENKHYSWKKGVSLLGLGDCALWPVDLDQDGKLSVAHLRTLLERAHAQQRPVLMVVSVAGSTELGAIDPVDDVQRLLDEWASRGIHIWHHVDAAYGGFFCSLDLQSSPLLREGAKSALSAIGKATSVTLDPHKLGYAPFACGAFLCREFSDYTARGFGAPYVQTTARDRGLFTLEGSRAATGAAATWMTARSIGLDPQGYGRILERTIRIKAKIEAALAAADKRFRVAPHSDTNILAFTYAEQGSPLSIANAAAERIYQAFSPNGKGPFVVSKTRLSIDSYGAYLREYLAQFNAVVDCSEMTVVRVCVMNPFFDSVEMKTDFVKEFIKNTAASVTA